MSEKSFARRGLSSFKDILEKKTSTPKNVRRSLFIQRHRPNVRTRCLDTPAEEEVSPSKYQAIQASSSDEDADDEKDEPSVPKSHPNNSSSNSSPSKPVTKKVKRIKRKPTVKTKTLPVKKVSDFAANATTSLTTTTATTTTINEEIPTTTTNISSDDTPSVGDSVSKMLDSWDQKYLYSSPQQQENSEDIKIQECHTPIRGDGDDDIDSQKTPVLRPNRIDWDNEIGEFPSPEKSTIVIKDEPNTTTTSSLNLDEKNLSNHNSSEDETSTAQKPRHSFKNQLQRILDETRHMVSPDMWNIQDSACLSLFVQHKKLLSNNTDKNKEPDFCLVQCYDLNLQTQRYIIMNAKISKDIHPEKCIKIYSPWHLSYLNFPNEKLELEVIHSAELYQIEPKDLSPTATDIKKCMESFRDKDFEKAFNVLVSGKISDGKSQMKFKTLIPQLYHHNNSIRKQTGMFRSSIELHAVIFRIYETKDYFRLLVQDADAAYCLIDILRSQFDKSPVLVTHQYRFSHLSMGSKVTVSAWTPLFSVLWAIDSTQKSYYRFLWTPETNFEEINDSVNGMNVAMKCPPLKITEILHDKERNVFDRRVLVEGYIKNVTRSEFCLTEEEGSNECIRIIVLQSCMKRPEVLDIGKFAKISFLRIYRDLCTLDQFSDLELKDQKKES